MQAAVSLRVDGIEVRAMAGATLAAALLDAGHVTLRRSVIGEPRGVLCGMGICFECRVTVDGMPHRRACMVTVRDGMEVGLGG